MEPGDISLTRIFDAFTGYQRTAALKAAIELDVFTAVGAGAVTLPALAERCGAAERGVRALANRLVVDGFLTKDGERYGLAPEAAVFLDRSSAAYVGSMIGFLTAPTITRPSTPDRGRPPRRHGVDAQGSLAPDHPVWVEFARAMAPGARMTAEVLAALLATDGPVRGSVLDIAAGHGLYGITLARHNPDVRDIAIDWAPVLEVAKQNAREAEVSDRFTPRPGSAFDVDWGTGHAVVLLTNFLHHFDPKECETLLRRARAALARGGRAVVVEFVPDESRVSPPEAAVFSLTMLASTPAGDAYTLAEYERMFGAAGFSGVSLHQLAPTPQQALLATA
jgi:hypothetical protein